MFYNIWEVYCQGTRHLQPVLVGHILTKSDIDIAVAREKATHKFADFAYVRLLGPAEAL